LKNYIEIELPQSFFANAQSKAFSLRPIVFFCFSLILIPSTLLAQSDDCFDAEPIGVFDECISKASATFWLTTYSTPNSCEGNTDDDGWFKFIAPTENIRITVSSDQLADMAVSVFETCNKELVCLNDKGMGGQESLYFEAEIDKEYFVQVYDFTEGGGGFRICISNFLPCKLEIEVGNPIWLCETSQTQLASNATGDTVGIQYQWRSLDGHIAYMDNPTSANPNTNLPSDFQGQISYELRATTNTCVLKDTAYVGRRCVDQAACPSLVATIEQQPIKCSAPNSGAINISVVNGGTPPYVYQVDATVLQSNPTFQNLAAGMHSLILQDSKGCQLDTFVELTNAILPTLDIGQDIFITQGTTVSLKASSNFPTAQIQQINWSNMLEADCPQPCLSIDFSALRSEAIVATIQTIDNCITQDTMLLRVEQKIDLFAPSAFSPNGDGINDYFTLFAAAGITKIATLRIFDRWGSLVFSRSDFLPNDPSLGWDGFSNNQVLESGVFVYYAELEVLDNPSIQQSGAVFLIR